MEMQNLIAVKTTPALIKVNFAELKTALETELEKYDVLVDAESIPDARKLMAELNKVKAAIDTARKDEVAKASEPIKAFDSQMKELSGMCSDGRAKLDQQVKTFEAELAKVAATLLDGLRSDLRLLHKVKPEYFNAEIDGLAKASSLTKGGKLTTKAINELESLIKNEKAWQDQTERRILELENKSYAAGLAAPLSRDHVQAFIFADDETYEREVSRIISAEIEREAVAAAKRKQAEEARAAAKAKAEEATAQPVAQQEAEKPEPEPTHAEPAIEAPAATQRAPRPAMADGRITYEVTATFMVPVKPNITEQQIREQLLAVMQKAGITTLESIGIRRA